ncbi:hypothetical protein [Streptomyces sp. NBC_00557]|uniref:hypothetical protein n=1 Tax=Streptomyces sp. NBC_00557 TaxID=2975776 RepID=UPI002E815FF0|nr:hypothetical protein [Streptomyces sp. NBC_00557]WUC36829.1 hypothetical protein OG956_22730 [Streptomyces sp. NBC_00557]
MPVILCTDWFVCAEDAEDAEPLPYALSFTFVPCFRTQDVTAELTVLPPPPGPPPIMPPPTWMCAGCGAPGRKL